jgi:RHS repeat-associated protein
LLAEYDILGACLKDYIYMGGRLIAEYVPATQQYFYYMQDQIGSTRVVTDDLGTVVYAEAHDPYGGIQKTWVNTFDPKRKFSDKERDGETGLDYFGARYYTSANYRWVSIDPVKQNGMNAPSHWNLYAFCLNNPMRYRDPTGKAAETQQTINIFVGTEDELDLYKIEQLKKKGYKVVIWEYGSWGRAEIKESLENKDAWTFYIGHAGGTISGGGLEGIMSSRGLSITINTPLSTMNENFGIFACEANTYADKLLSGKGTLWFNKGWINPEIAAAGLATLVERLAYGDSRAVARSRAIEAMWTRAGDDNLRKIDHNLSIEFRW